MYFICNAIIDNLETYPPKYYSRELGSLMLLTKNIYLASFELASISKHINIDRFSYFLCAALGGNTIDESQTLEARYQILF